MKRNILIPLSFSIVLLCGGSLPSTAAWAEESSNEITPFASEQYPTEVDATNLNKTATDEENGEESSVSQRSLFNSTNEERAKKTGTVYVMNKSDYGAYVYLDGYLAYGSCLAPSHTLKITKVPRGQHELEAIDCADSSYGWGSRSFNLKKKYTWTLKN